VIATSFRRLRRSASPPRPPPPSPPPPIRRRRELPSMATILRVRLRLLELRSRCRTHPDTRWLDSLPWLNAMIDFFSEAALEAERRESGAAA